MQDNKENSEANGQHNCKGKKLMNLKVITCTKAHIEEESKLP